MAIDPEAYTAIQPELASGEQVLWAGRPSPRLILHKEDAIAIPFSLVWGGFAIFWELGVTGSASPGFFVLWGIPFVLAGQYFIWGRFVYAAWQKKRTFYAVTSRRVLVVQNGWSHQTSIAFINALPGLTKQGRAGRPGTVRFGQPQIIWAGNRGAFWNNMSLGPYPVFVDIDEADYVYRLVSDMRDKA
jgi:hypothetical protein